jgi:hypothetical protein
MNALAYHESVRDLLQHLSSLEESLGPNELISMWFDDLYFPAQSRPNDYSAVSWDRGQTEWSACFTTEELSALAKFHAIFDHEVANLSTEWSTWRSDPGWSRVSEAARVVLANAPSMRSNKSLERTREG